MMVRRKLASMSDLVFFPMSSKRIDMARESLKTLGVHYSPHDCRRTFCTVAERLDLSFSVLKRLMNHSEKGNVTMNYIGADVERLRKPMQQITDYILSKSTIS
jgi:integrase